MLERYLPASEFLNRVIEGEIAFEGSPIAHTNLQYLLTMVGDPDQSNRDWATFVISGLPLDTADIRNALLKAADDPDPDTRDEAIVGLARRDRAEALMRLSSLLPEDFSLVLIEAATILGDPGLLPALKTIEGWEVRGRIREQLQHAIAACEAGIGSDRWPDGEQPFRL